MTNKKTIPVDYDKMTYEQRKDCVRTIDRSKEPLPPPLKTTWTIITKNKKVYEKLSNGKLRYLGELTYEIRNKFCLKDNSVEVYGGGSISCMAFRTLVISFGVKNLDSI
ncbi:MAG: hypothetical protein LBV22_01930 [Mycoplasmataceae bacterium]|jgi:hypothetical protein|nr:hypothetical protein [Mycoplasmataceae bacterium]